MPDAPVAMRRTLRVEDDGRCYEDRERVGAVVSCPKCVRDVQCWQETFEWFERHPGDFRHAGYGPATGECCGLLLVVDFNGCRAYEFPAEEPDV